MNKNRPQIATWKRRAVRTLFFPGSVFAIYGILFASKPDKASMALKSSGSILFNLIVPLCFVLVLMLVLNLFLKPGNIARFLGRGAGIKGIILSTAAGIVSMGPIYAWYPMLRDLREKGAASSLIAIFLGNRAVKPFLLPIMISYFSLTYVLILTVFTILGSLAVGYSVGALLKKNSGLSSSI